MPPTVGTCSVWPPEVMAWLASTTAWAAEWGSAAPVWTTWPLAGSIAELGMALTVLQMAASLLCSCDCSACWPPSAEQQHEAAAMLEMQAGDTSLAGAEAVLTC